MKLLQELLLENARKAVLTFQAHLADNPWIDTLHIKLSRDVEHGEHVTLHRGGKERNVQVKPDKEHVIITVNDDSAGNWVENYRIAYNGESFTVLYHDRVGPNLGSNPEHAVERLFPRMLTYRVMSEFEHLPKAYTAYQLDNNEHAIYDEHGSDHFHMGSDIWIKILSTRVTDSVNFKWHKAEHCFVLDSIGDYYEGKYDRYDEPEDPDAYDEIYHHTNIGDKDIGRKFTTVESLVEYIKGIVGE